jgi:4-alpha-glucanotransferase
MLEPGYFHTGRHAGLLMPLFSMPSHESWGVGEIPDLARFARWLEQAGVDFVQLLPVNEMDEGQNSPYSALSAMAFDPVFISLAHVPEFHERGGERVLDREDRRRLDRARQSKAVDFRSVRAVKTVALQASFAAFRERHPGSDSERGRAFREFAERERWWLDEYALFRALHDEHHAAYWREWEPPLRHRDPQALSQARVRLGSKIHYYEYLQFLADEQWRRARRDGGRVGIFGDFPFMVSGHSADVWARQNEFRLDASVGVPPDAFSETGQNWGLPAYRWRIHEKSNYEWLRQRARRCTELFDGFRIDHLVGFYRTYVREPDGRRHFTPPNEPDQLAQGERLIRAFRDTSACIVAEDLGSVPDFVRESLARLHVPGLKVLRWERHWHTRGQPFRMPDEYPTESVALSGTHDTETLADWWDEADDDERRLCAELPDLREAGCTPDAPFSPAIRDALVRTLYRAASDFVILPIHDVFGWRDRINVPAVVDDKNWTWRLRWPVDELSAQPEAQERAAFLRRLARESGRSSVVISTPNLTPPPPKHRRS